MIKSFGHLETDVPAADHKGAARLPLRQGGEDSIHIAETAQAKDMRQVDAGNRRCNRLGSLTEDQPVRGIRRLESAAEERVAPMGDTRYDRRPPDGRTV